MLGSGSIFLLFFLLALWNVRPGGPRVHFLIVFLIGPLKRKVWGLPRGGFREVRVLQINFPCSFLLKAVRKSPPGRSGSSRFSLFSFGDSELQILIVFLFGSLRAPFPYCFSFLGTSKLPFIIDVFLLWAFQLHFANAFLLGSLRVPFSYYFSIWGTPGSTSYCFPFWGLQAPFSDCFFGGGKTSYWIILLFFSLGHNLERTTFSAQPWARNLVRATLRAQPWAHNLVAEEKKM